MKILKYIILSIALMGLIACGGSSSPSNKAPTVNAGEDVTVERNKEVTLKGTAKDSDGTIKSYVWEKGSKVLSKKANFKYIPTTVGKETLILTVTDDDGATASDKVVVDVMMRPFITKWKLSHDRDSITIPTISTEKYNYSVDWGDGTVSKNQTQSASHKYKDPTKVYRVKIWGIFPRIYFKKFQGDMPFNLLSIEQWGDIEWSSMSGAFKRCNRLEGEAKDTPDLSKVTDMSEMFAGANEYDDGKFLGKNSFNQDISNWDVSNVVNMSNLFYFSNYNKSLNSWNVSNVIDMHQMFYFSEFNQPLNSWNVSNVIDMHEMFRKTDFNQNISSWDLSNVIDMKMMFYEAKYFNQPINSWDVSSVTNMSGMFYYSLNFNQPLDNWNVSNVIDMHEMFMGTDFNQNISSWDVSSVTDMSNLFMGTDFNQPINSWNVSNVTNMNRLFYLSDFNQSLDDWDVSSVTMMFEILKETSFSTKNYDNLLKSWSQLNLQKNVRFGLDSTYSNNLDSVKDIFINQFNWTIEDGGKVLAFNNLYHEAYIGESVDISSFLTNTKEVISYKWEENGTLLSSKNSLSFSDSTQEGMHKIKITLTMSDKSEISEDVFVYLSLKGSPKPFITEWKVFNGACDGFSDYKITIPTKGDGYNYTISWGDGAVDYNVTGDISHTYQKYGLYKVYIRGNFPRIYFKYTCAVQLYGIEQWGDIEWKSMKEAFSGAFAFSDNSSKDTPNLSKVTDMSYMFDTGEEGEYKPFNLDMSGWDVSNITNMEGLFWGRKYFNQDIGKWDVSNVTNMSSMFKWARSFNQDISGWDVSNVTNMSYMFDGSQMCSESGCGGKIHEINQDFSKWDISNVESMTNMFQRTKLSTENYDKILYGWSELSLQQGVAFGVGGTKYHKSLNKNRNLIISNFNWTITDGGIVE